MDLEYREFRAEDVSVDSEGKLHGVALPFNRQTTIGDPKRGGWREEAAPGVAKKSLQEGDVLFLAHHDMHMPLARMSAGNLSLRETAENLRYEVDPADTSYGRDIRALAHAKVLGGVSIGFRPVKDEWRDDDGNPSDRHNGTHRILREIQLIEISAVTNPAYKDTSIMARDALLAEREARADLTADLPHLEQRELDVILDMLFEDRASSISAADRKALAAKGHALADGSYPIPDKDHLHAAAVLAASKHGNYRAAKKLIRKRAKALGVDVTTLPGFGGKKASRSADEGAVERRIKKGTAKRVLQIDAELKQAMGLFTDVDKLPEPVRQGIALVTSAAEHAEHIAHKENLTGKSLSRSEQKPDTSTSAPDDDDDFALRMAEMEFDLRSRERRFV